MHYQPPAGMEGAQYHVKCEPCHKNATRPIETAKQKHTAEQPEQPDDQNHDGLIRTLLKLREALSRRQQAAAKGDDANNNEQPTDNCN